VELQVTRRVKRDRIHAAAVAMDPQRDLLSHRSTRHQHGGILPEHVGNPPLKGLDHCPLAVSVRPRVCGERISRRSKKIGGGRAPSRAEPTLAPPHDLAPVTFGHAPSLYRHRDLLDHDLECGPAGWRMQ